MIAKNTAKVIKFLLRNLEKSGYNINQIAKNVKISVGSAFKILKELEKDKIVTANKLGNAIYYLLNLDNPEAVKLSELLLMKEKRELKSYARLYAESVQPFDKAELIVLFGSVLTKKEFNDVDILFVAEKPQAVSNLCLELSKTRTKPIVPLILKKEDLINEINKKNEAILSIVMEGVVIKGESVFLEVIKDAKK